MQEENPKRKTHTSSTVRNRYKKKTYKSYTFIVRYDDPLNEKLDQYPESLSELIRSLLKQHFNPNSKP